MRFWLQLVGWPHRALAVRSGGILAELSGDVSVALGLAHLEVAEDLLDDTDADALIQQERRSGMTGVAGVVDTSFLGADLVEQVGPVGPFGPGVDGSAGRRAEHEIPVLPGCNSSALASA